MPEQIITEIPVTVYGKLEKYNDVISKARCRTFYKYGNRNGTYITDEFADLLLSTVPYAPVKGIYDNYEEDFTDHGAARNLGRIYGVVPENPNVTWEKHLDEDGIEREYACVDVLIFTGLYKEASEIVGKSQSMELYDKTIEGEWQFIDGKKYYVFKKGCFLGLQALGDEVEPCFEGAAFFSLVEPIKQLVREYNEFQMNFQKQGGQEMPRLNFKLSDSAKHDAIWSLLNPNYCEEGGWSIDYSICDIYDDYAIVRNYAEGIFERQYYAKDDATDSIILGQKKRCYIVDVTEEEKIALDTLQKLNGNTFEKIDENFTANETVAEQNGVFEQKIEELETSVSTLTTERDEAVVALNTANESLEASETKVVELNNSLSEANSSIEELTQKNEELTSFKAAVEKKEKEDIIASYSDKLSAEVIDQFTTDIDNYNATDLKKELAYTLVENNPAVFSKEPQGYVPKDGPKGGIEEILSKYKK